MRAASAHLSRQPRYAPLLPDATNQKAVKGSEAWVATCRRLGRTSPQNVLCCGGKLFGLTYTHTHTKYKDQRQHRSFCGAVAFTASAVSLGVAASGSSSAGTAGVLATRPKARKSRAETEYVITHKPVRPPDSRALDFQNWLSSNLPAHF